MNPGNVVDSTIDFENFLKVQTVYELKTVARSNSNFYCDAKENIEYRRKETDAEHVYSSLKLAHFFIVTEPEFHGLNRLVIFDTLLYHDDVEIETQDISISDVDARKNKDQTEREALPRLAVRYPRGLDEVLFFVDGAYRANNTPEMRFCHAVDKMDALVHELKYPADWGPKGFSEHTVRKWFQPAFEYSPTFMVYFERIVQHLRENDYF